MLKCDVFGWESNMISPGHENACVWMVPTTLPDGITLPADIEVRVGVWVGIGVGVGVGVGGGGGRGMGWW